MFESELFKLLWDNSLITLYMTFATTIIAYGLGIPMGMLLVISARDGIRPMPSFNWILGGTINLIRAVPFLILVIAISPLTRAVIGTTIGPMALTFGLMFSATPFVARLVEQSLLEVDYGVIEAAQSMGASGGQIMRKVLLPEAIPSLLNGALVATTTILGYSAMAGFVGGGGLGDLAIKYGYYRYENDIMWITVVMLVVLVQVIQILGSNVVRRTDKRIND